MSVQNRLNEYISNRLNPQKIEVDAGMESATEKSEDQSFDSSNFDFEQYKYNYFNELETQPYLSAKKELKRLKKAFERECAICLESTSSYVETRCNHYYCEDCLCRWLERVSTCPYCRKQVRYYMKNNKKIKTKQKEYEESENDEELEYECYQCDSTNEGDIVVICDRCQVKACHVECDETLHGQIPTEEEEWFCHECR